MKKYLILLAASLLMAACNEEAAELPYDGSMRFEAVHPASRATATEFEMNDRIGIYVTDYAGEKAPTLQISGNWANNVAADFDGTNWLPTKKIFWSENKMDVYAYYPYMELTSVDLQPFSIALDQNTERTEDALGGYEASDFLWAKTEGLTTTESAVPLRFRHCMSKFIIKLVKGPAYDGDLPDNAAVYIHNVVPSAHIDLKTGTVVKDGYGEPVTVKCRKVDNGTYEAIIVPQRVEYRLPFVELIVNGISYLVEDTFHFRQGKAHTYNLTINSNPDQVKVEIGGSVEGGWDS